MASDKPAGYGTMHLGGQERPFHVGFEQGAIFCKLRNRLNPEDGTPMSLKAYGDLFNPLTKPQERLSGEDIRDFVYSALKSGAEEDGLPVDYSARMVSQWIDQSDDPQQAAKPLEEMYRQMTARVERQVERLKNAAAPSKPGPKPKKATGPAGLK